MMQAWANGHVIESLQAQRELEYGRGTQTALEPNQGNGNDLVAAPCDVDNPLKALQRS